MRLILHLLKNKICIYRAAHHLKEYSILLRLCQDVLSVQHTTRFRTTSLRDMDKSFIRCDREGATAGFCDFRRRGTGKYDSRSGLADMPAAKAMGNPSGLRRI